MADIAHCYMLGKCANGAERDSGTVVHLRRSDEWRSLCGKEPGRRSAGWSQPLNEIPKWARPCPRCAAKHQETPSVAQ